MKSIKNIHFNIIEVCIQNKFICLLILWLWNGLAVAIGRLMVDSLRMPNLSGNVFGNNSPLCLASSI